MQTAVAVASSHWSDLSARRGSTSPQCLHILYTIIHFVALTLSYKGRRTVSQRMQLDEMQLDERYMFQIVPFNREIQNF